MRRLFVLEIEQGQEVYIPTELSQKSLPLSFRYYDPIIVMTQSRIKDEQKDFFKLRNKLERQIFRKIDTKTQFLERMGFMETQDKKLQKLTFKYEAVNKKMQKEINVHTSFFTKGVQRSNYLMIDNELMEDLHKNP